MPTGSAELTCLPVTYDTLALILPSGSTGHLTVGKDHCAPLPHRARIYTYIQPLTHSDTPTRHYTNHCHPSQVLTLDMDLTPPSLTASPYSPQRKSIDSPPPYAYCQPEASSVDFAALTSLDHPSYNVPPPYGSFIDPLLSDQCVNGSAHMTSLDSMTSTGHWNNHSVAVAGSPQGSATSTMPHLLSSSEYDHFHSYEQTCLPITAYATTAGPYGRPTPQHSPAFMHTSPSSTADLPGREQTAFPPHHRASFSFPTEQTVSKADATNVLSYRPLDQDHSFTPPSRPLHQRLPSGYLQELQQSQPPVHTGSFPAHLATQPPPQLPLTTTKQASKMHPGQPRYVRQRTTRERPARRRLTSVAEANHQCEVKGCGKYFSRNYNYKSHMETHKEEREKPFVCKEPNCSKKFVRKTDLQRHHKSVHDKERSHECDFCSRMFARKDTLRRYAPPTFCPCHSR